MDNKWYEDDQVLNAHEPAATRENPVMASDLINLFSFDGDKKRRRSNYFERSLLNNHISLCSVTG